MIKRRYVEPQGNKCRSRRVNGCHKQNSNLCHYVAKKEAFVGFDDVSNDKRAAATFFSCPSCLHLFMYAYFTWWTASQYYLVSLWSKLVSVAAHQCAALTCRAVCRRVDIVASFKLPSVGERLGANEAPEYAVRVRLSSSSNKRMNIVVQMCSLFLLIACCGCIISW